MGMMTRNPSHLLSVTGRLCTGGAERCGELGVEKGRERLEGWKYIDRLEGGTHKKTS